MGDAQFEVWKDAQKCRDPLDEDRRTEEKIVSRKGALAAFTASRFYKLLQLHVSQSELRAVARGNHFPEAAQLLDPHCLYICKFTNAVNTQLATVA
jgi:hypothetical protein